MARTSTTKQDYSPAGLQLSVEVSSEGSVRVIPALTTRRGNEFVVRYTSGTGEDSFADYPCRPTNTYVKSAGGEFEVFNPFPPNR